VETGEERSVVMRAKDQTVLPENRHKNLSPIHARELCGIALRQDYYTMIPCGSQGRDRRAVRFYRRNILIRFSVHVFLIEKETNI
jgi:hypothetical protein